MYDKTTNDSTAEALEQSTYLYFLCNISNHSKEVFNTSFVYRQVLTEVGRQRSSLKPDTW